MFFRADLTAGLVCNFVVPAQSKFPGVFNPSHDAKGGVVSDAFWSKLVGVCQTPFYQDHPNLFSQSRNEERRFPRIVMGLLGENGVPPDDSASIGALTSLFFRFVKFAHIASCPDEGLYSLSDVERRRWAEIFNIESKTSRQRILGYVGDCEAPIPIVGEPWSLCCDDILAVNFVGIQQGAPLQSSDYGIGCGGCENKHSEDRHHRFGILFDGRPDFSWGWFSVGVVGLFIGAFSVRHGVFCATSLQNLIRRYFAHDFLTASFRVSKSELAEKIKKKPRKGKVRATRFGALRIAK
jgi:hypothetical protein